MYGMAQHQIDNSVRPRDPNHPDRVRLRKNLEFAQELRQLREKQLDEQWQNRRGNASYADISHR